VRAEVEEEEHEAVFDRIAAGDTDEVERASTDIARCGRS
jgi:DNA-binding GntR family transcriptional regulator